METNLEKNNLEAQIELLDDILENDRHIFYHIQQRGKELLSLTHDATFDKDYKTATISKEDFDKIRLIGSMLENEDRFSQLGNLASNAVSDTISKRKILQILRK